MNPSNYKPLNMKVILYLICLTLFLTGCHVNYERLTHNDWAVAWILIILFALFLASGVKNWLQAKNNYNKRNKDQIS